MTRRSPRFIVLLALLATLVAACGGGNTGPILTDPTAIITAALKSSEAAKSVHIEASVDGTVPVALTPGGAGTEVNLTGTTASVDVDIANAEAHATFSVPKVLGLAGELIQADGKTYLKTTLTGSKFKVLGADSSLPVDPTNMGGMIDTLGDFLLKPGVDPVKGEDVSCNGGTCYTIVVDLDATELAALVGTGASSLPVDVAGATLKLTLRVEQTLPNHLAGIAIEIGLSDGKSVAADLTFSKWDEPVTITAPPADQVDAG